MSLNIILKSKFDSHTATNLATSELGSNINDEGDNIFNGSLIRGTFNNNSIFDSKVHKHRTTTYVEGISTVEQLIQKFLDYSSTLLNDSLLTVKVVASIT